MYNVYKRNEKSPRWSRGANDRRGSVGFIEHRARPPNVFSRAPSIKGIFMQRAKVIRSLGMHIARASHGLFLSLPLCSLLCSQPDGETDREKAKPSETSPKTRCLSVRPVCTSVRLPRLFDATSAPLTFVVAKRYAKRVAVVCRTTDAAREAHTHTHTQSRSLRSLQRPIISTG